MGLMKLFNKSFYKFFFSFLTVITITLFAVFVIGSGS
jgi:hypothetical protein